MPSNYVKCPLCSVKQVSQYKVRISEQKEPVTWYHCFCGSLFHTQPIDKSIFNQEYADKWAKLKECKIRENYTFRNYINLMEELTYGRKFLDVGFTVDHNLTMMSERGWIPMGVDIVPNKYISDDFEKFDFDDKFDMIHMGHCLEIMDDPIKAFNRACSLLSKSGILFITSASPELLDLIGIEHYGHLSKPSEIKTLISKKIYSSLAEKNDMDIVLYHFNISKRFCIWNDAHIIMQKRS